MKLQLPQVTLLCVDCVNTNRAIRVLEKCKQLCDFGDVKFLTSLPCTYNHKVDISPLNSLIEYSVFMLTKSHEFINTSHILVVQRDGWILNPDAFDYNWLHYDYIAPLFVQYDRVGSGGFSLRTKRLMEETARMIPKWDGTPKRALEIQQGLHYYEDGVISFTVSRQKFRFPSLMEASQFAQGGNPNPEYYIEKPFGFHGAFQHIDHPTGIVSRVCEHNGGCNCAMEHLQYLKSLAD